MTFLLQVATQYVLKEAKESLMVRFKMKDLALVLSWFLSIQFKCKSDCIEMNQNQHVEKTVKVQNVRLQAKSSPM